MDQSLVATAQQLTVKEQALISAVDTGDTKTVVDLLDLSGVPIDTKDDEGKPLLHRAAKSGQVTTMRLLIRRGCDVDSVDAKGLTPLHCAAGRGQTKAVQELIKHNAATCMVAGRFGTPLHLATVEGYVETAAILLEDAICASGLAKQDGTSKAKAECNLIHTCDSAGHTPVMLALSSGQVEVFKLLTSKGGLISGRDSHSLSTFEHCFIGGHAGKLSQFCEACGIRSSEEGLKGALATLITWGMVDAHKVLCLCAVSGDSTFLDDDFNELVVSDQCALPGAVKFAKDWMNERVLLINQLKIPDGDALHPLHISLVSMKLCEMGYSDLLPVTIADHITFIEKLLSHPVLKKSVHTTFPNGLSPLDLAQQFKLHDIAALIKEAGGGPGMWADIPQEIEANHPLELLQLKEAYAPIKAIAVSGKHGHEFIRYVLSSVLQQPINDRSSPPNSEQQGIEDILKQKPSMPELAHLIVSQVSTKNWMLVGDLLLKDIANAEKTLNYISHQISDDRNRFRETLSYWLEHSSSVTWKTLLDALGHFETKNCIDELTGKIVEEIGGAPQVSVQVL